MKSDNHISFHRPSPATLKKDTQKGFSLIELAIVVGIIGILAAIAIPAYRNYQATAKQKIADNILEQFPVLLETFRAENGQFPGAGPYTYAEDDNGNVTANTIGGSSCTAPPCPLPEFQPKKATTGVTLYHYTLTINNPGATNESAAFTATPQVNRGAPPGVRSGTYQ